MFTSYPYKSFKAHLYQNEGGTCANHTDSISPLKKKDPADNSELLPGKEEGLEVHLEKELLYIKSNEINPLLYVQLLLSKLNITGIVVKEEREKE